MGAIYRDVIFDLLSMKIQTYSSVVEEILSKVTSTIQSEGDEEAIDSTKSDDPESGWWDIVSRLEKCSA